MAAWGPLLEEKGIETITYDDANLAAFRERVAGPAAEAWVADAEGRGLPGQELYDLVSGMAAEQ